MAAPKILKKKRENLFMILAHWDCSSWGKSLQRKICNQICRLKLIINKNKEHSYIWLLLCRLPQATFHINEQNSQFI